jgi:hypothetical protein
MECKVLQELYCFFVGNRPRKVRAKAGPPFETFLNRVATILEGEWLKGTEISVEVQ